MRAVGILPGIFLPILLGCTASERPIVIGSKNFTEQTILGELLAQQIEFRTGLRVDRKVHLGGTLICHQALRSGDLDLYVEYSGTALTAILDEPPTGDRAEVFRRVRSEYGRRFDLEWGDPLGFNDTFAMVIRGEDARQLGIRRISDVIPHAPGWRIGFSFEFLERSDGYQGLIETYDLRFKESPRTMELGLVLRALKEGRVEIVAGNSTDGLIDALDLFALEDDRNYFPPYEAAPVYRPEVLRRHEGVAQALEDLAGKISDDVMRRLNYAVDGERRKVADVVREFRRGLNP
jgi:glycine betaine/choline ABC-type transport system substrate-binding protein